MLGPFLESMSGNPPANLNVQDVFVQHPQDYNRKAEGLNPFSPKPED